MCTIYFIKTHPMMSRAASDKHINILVVKLENVPTQWDGHMPG